MNILIVSGIWPPDVGGPASHAPEVADELQKRGHSVQVVITADGRPGPKPYPLHWSSRRSPRGVRHARSTLTIARAARGADVVYTTGMVVRTALAAVATRRPYVLKLTSDPAFERALRYRLTSPDLDDFHRARGQRVAALRRASAFATRRAKHLVVPSDALRQLALGWGIAPERITVLPNAIAAPALPSREELRRRNRIEGPVFVFAGRLAPQKRLDVALDAVERVADVKLLIAGSGPDEDDVRRRAEDPALGGRVTVLGPQPRERVFELLRSADAALLSSSWENFPHMAVEALAVGTPVVATAVGGVTEIVRDGENGLLVPSGEAAALAEAISRIVDEDGLRERLSAGAPASVERFAPEVIYDELERILERTAS